MVLLPVVLASLLISAPDPKAPLAIKKLPDITYGTLGGEKMQLDLVMPSQPGTYPCVICLHGGAWSLGTRKDPTRLSLGTPFWTESNRTVGIMEKLAEQGFAVASVSYRFIPKHKFPSQIEDGKTAIRFLRANAKKYDLDPDRFGALGFSAGGHIALMLGLTDSTAGFDGELHPGVSSQVQCVVDFFGPTDMRLYAECEGLEDAFMVPLLGKQCKTDPAVYKKASPIEYVTKAAPPTLLIHGTLDLIVPTIHSERLHKKLLDLGVESEMLPMQWKGHGWGGDAVRESALASLKFLNKHLIKPVGK
jgi:acetyl esterase/lipase